MTESPASFPNPPRSLWKPIGITLLTSFLLALTTCAGGIRFGKDSGAILIYAGLFFTALFVLTLCFAAIYFVIRLLQNGGSK